LPIPAQVPAVPVKVDPRLGVPVTAGLPVLTGGALGIAAVAALAATAVPSGLAVVTSARTVAPTSATVSS
jgi:hypothetical protein